MASRVQADDQEPTNLLRKERSERRRREGRIMLWNPRENEENNRNHVGVNVFHKHEYEQLLTPHFSKFN